MVFRCGSFVAAHWSVTSILGGVKLVNYGLRAELGLAGGAASTAMEDVSRSYFPNFDWIRLLLAVQVVALHSGITNRVFVNPVPAFIAISGFVVFGSLKRRTVGEFFISRAIRVLPLLIVTFGVVGLVHGWQAMLRNVEYWIWPRGSEPINPVVWSLLYEEAYYALLALLYVLGAYRKIWISSSITVLAITISVALPKSATLLMWLYLGGAFFLGNVTYLARYNIGKVISPWGAVLVLCALALTSYLTPYTAVLRQNVLDFVCFTAVICFAIAGPQLPRLKIDLSYSLYLIHCLIRDQLWGRVGFGSWQFFVAMILGSIPFCLIAWFLIEKPALSLKKYLRASEKRVSIYR